MSAAAEDWGQILHSLQRGDRVALVKVTRVITGYLARFRAYDLRDSWDDLVNDVLEALLKALRNGSIRDPQALVGFLGTITRNKLADFLERKSRPGGADAVGSPEVAEEIGAVIRDVVARDPDELIDLQRAMATLPEKERLVVEALYAEGRSYDEAAGRLGMPLGTLKRLQTQGLRNLRRSMGVVSRRARSDFPEAETHS